LDTDAGLKGRRWLTATSVESFSRHFAYTDTQPAS
jgi:hypothetical protein